MATRYGLQAAFAIAVLIFGKAPGLLEYAPAQPGAGADLAKILDEWQRRSAARKSLEVRYVGVNDDRAWDSREPFSGRVVLFSKVQALAEVTRGEASKKDNDYSERLIWKDDALHQIQPAMKQDTVWPISAKDRGRLPAPLALPFLWNMSTKLLESRYRVELVKEEAETWLLSVTPLTKPGRDWCSKAFIWLDRATYLPRRYHVRYPDGKRSTDYRVTEVRCDLAVPEEALRVPGGKGWEVIAMDESQFGSWFARLFTIELVP
jgi:hypothetical protein